MVVLDQYTHSTLVITLYMFRTENYSLTGGRYSVHAAYGIYHASTLTCR